MSEVKVNKISPRTACGTVTLGDSGDTFTIPAGATITNKVRRQGSVQQVQRLGIQQLKQQTFTAVSGVGYFVNTTSEELRCNLPAGSAGAVVALADYAGYFSDK